MFDHYHYRKNHCRQNLAVAGAGSPACQHAVFAGPLERLNDTSCRHLRIANPDDRLTGLRCVLGFGSLSDSFEQVVPVAWSKTAAGGVYMARYCGLC